MAPFKSKAQQRLMFAKHPKIAKKWADEYGVPKTLPEKLTDKSCPGGKIRSKGQGRGLGTGGGRGPIGR